MTDNAQPSVSRLPQFRGGACPLYLAPMAGFTDSVFRALCRRHGADVVVSEFVMANKFLDPRGEAIAWRTVDFSPEQRPMGIQIFGSEPDTMARAAQRIVERLRPDFLDLNFGCPAPKVVDVCAGSSLLCDLPRLRAVVAAVVREVSAQVPVTAKIRIGWDATQINAVEVGQLLEAEGVEAVAVHGRTKEQGYRGEADWDVIQAVAEALQIPVIGNGSVDSAEKVQLLRSQRKVSGLMIGRAALGYPWIFGAIKHTLTTGSPPPEPTTEERWQTMLDYCDALLQHTGQSPWDRLGWMRARLKAFTKRMPGGRHLRARLETLQSAEELHALSAKILESEHPSAVLLET